jgi:hypothetical protein
MEVDNSQCSPFCSTSTLSKNCDPPSPLHSGAGFFNFRALLIPMLKTNEIFSRLPEPVAGQIFDYLQKEQPNLISIVVDTLAREQKLRPIFVQRKTEAERRAWLKKGLGQNRHAGDAAHLLQIWLVGAQAKLLCDFLDALGFAHDENGTLEELPPAPEKAKLTEAVDKIMATHEPAVVVVYLHAFQATDEKGWSTLEELLGEDARLKL